MDKRAFLAIALSILILVIYQEWMTRYYGTPTVAPEAEKKSRREPQSLSNRRQPLRRRPNQPRFRSAATLRTSRVETDNYIALFTNQGLVSKSFKFKNYRSSVQRQSPFRYSSVRSRGTASLGVRWQNPAPFDDEELLYSVEGSDLKLAGESKNTLVFRGRTANGTVITKTFTFSGSTYPISF